MTLESKLKEILELAEKATEGPWICMRTPVSVERIVIWKEGFGEVAKVDGTTKNTAFIAASRSLVPQLIAVIEKQSLMFDDVIKSLFIAGYDGTEKIKAKYDAELLKILEGK